VILEPQKDVRSLVARRMAHLTAIPEETVVKAIEKQAKTHYTYAMASSIFRKKPTFLLRKWIARTEGEQS
jgi:F420-non-reducing hydrogenase small subunit